MKPDVLFLLLVVVAGLFGLYLNTKNSHDYLADLKQQTERRKSAKPGGITRSTINSSVIHSSNIGEEDDRNNIHTSANSTPVTPEQVFELWADLYDAWKTSLLDNITDRTGVLSIKTSAPCTFDMMMVDKGVIGIRLSDVSLARDGSTIYLMGGERVELELKNILRPIKVTTKTKDLIKYCAIVNNG